MPRLVLTNSTPAIYPLGALCGKEGGNTQAVSLGQSPRSVGGFPAISPESMKRKTNQSLTHHSHDTIIITNGNSNIAPKFRSIYALLRPGPILFAGVFKVASLSQHFLLKLN